MNPSINEQRMARIAAAPLTLPGPVFAEALGVLRDAFHAARG